jgi:hypothetical protein
MYVLFHCRLADWAPALNSARIPVTRDLGFRIRFFGLGLGLPFRVRV